MPSLDAWDGEFGRVPSENMYADVDGDHIPEVAIGRLPVTTLEEAETLVDKIGRQADVVRAAGSTHVFAADNQGGDDISFLGEAAKAAGLLPPGSQAEWADVSQGIVQARGALRSGLNAGVLATHYFGHGGFDIWADEGLLTVDDVDALPSNRRETILFTWTCEAQWYQLRPGINEALLLHPQGGALAALGPAGITDPALQTLVFPRVYRYFFAGETLGESVRLAKAEALAASASTRPVVEGWNLLGDPALRLDVGPSRLDGAAARLDNAAIGEAEEAFHLVDRHGLRMLAMIELHGERHRVKVVPLRGQRRSTTTFDIAAQALLFGSDDKNERMTRFLERRTS